MPAVHLEGAFEAFIAGELSRRGWIHGDPNHWNRELALDTVQLFAFLSDSQPKQWAKLSGVHGASFGPGALVAELSSDGNDLRPSVRFDGNRKSARGSGQPGAPRLP